MKMRKMDSRYLEMREGFFNIKKESLKLTSRKDASIYGAVVDIVVKNRLLTIVCLLNGKTNVYAGDKKSYFRDNGEHETIYKATKTFLINVEQIFDMFKETTDFSPNEEIKENIFLLTDKGVFSAKAAGKSKKVKFLRYLYKSVLIKVINAHSYSCLGQRCRTCIMGNFLNKSCLMKKALQD